MKNKLTQKTKVLAAVGILSAMSISTIAAPIIQEVKANLKANISYTLNGENVLEGKGGLVYNNQVYIPVRDVANTLGFTVDYKNDTVIMNTKEVIDTKGIQGEPIADPKADTITIEKAVIKTINLESKQVTILPEGKEDKVENYLVLNLGSETTIGHYKAKRLFALEDLTEGMQVRVTHSPMLTRSIPAQSPAFNITILDELENQAVENVVFKNLVIVEVNEAKDSIVVADAKDSKNLDTQKIIHLNEKTNIKHEKNKRLYNANDLAVGQKVTVTVGPAATLSLPPQMSGIEIMLVD